MLVMNVVKPAGFWLRLGAQLLDGILLSIIIGLLSILIYGEFFSADESALNVLNLLYALFLPVVWYGYTIGKRVLGVRIVKLDGGNVKIGTMLMRTLVSGLVYAITFGIGLIVSIFMVALRDDKRALHDFIAKTYVTTEPPAR